LSKTEPSKFFLLFLVAVAIAAFALVPMVLFSPNLQTYQTNLRHQLITVAYAVVCISGIAAVFHPKKCSMMFKKPLALTTSKKASASTLEFKGHHPNCENYSTNRVIILERVLCAACSGLLIGAIASIIGVVAYSVGLFALDGGSFWVFIVGAGFMLGGLAQIKTAGYIKLVVNALFVVGSAIVLIEADWAGQSLLADGYVLALIVFMLWLRIMISEYNNNLTCIICGRCG
jgi:hypothetical protein